MRQPLPSRKFSPAILASGEYNVAPKLTGKTTTALPCSSCGPIPSSREQLPAGFYRRAPAVERRGILRKFLRSYFNEVVAGGLAARLALPIARGDRVAETQSYMALEKSRNHVDACEPAF